MQLRTWALPAGRPALMGILNVTPDSFSDGGVHFAPQNAIDAGLRMLDDGADILDVGGESTRPGAAEVDAEEEISRVLPVVEGLAGKGAIVSIDTMKPEVARRALDAGATILNDVNALGAAGMAAIASDYRCTVCLMHMRGNPRTMQQDPAYGDVTAEVRDYLLQRAEFAMSHGVAKENIWLDPGIGFGKTVEHNLELLANLEHLVATGYPLLIGVSRKSFIGKLLGDPPLPISERLEGTLSAQVVAQIKGARIIRAHDVKQSRRAMDIAAAILARA